MIIKILNPKDNELIAVVKSVQEFIDYKHGLNYVKGVDEDGLNYVKGVDEDGFSYFQDGTGIGFCALRALHSELVFKEQSLFNCKTYKGSRYDQKGISDSAQGYLIKEIERDFSKEYAKEYLEIYNKLVGKKWIKKNLRIVNTLKK